MSLALAFTSRPPPPPTPFYLLENRVERYFNDESRYWRFRLGQKTQGNTGEKLKTRGSKDSFGRNFRLRILGRPKGNLSCRRENISWRETNFCFFFFFFFASHAMNERNIYERATRILSWNYCKIYAYIIIQGPACLLRMVGRNFPGDVETSRDRRRGAAGRSNR